MRIFEILKDATNLETFQIRVSLEKGQLLDLNVLNIEQHSPLTEAARSGKLFAVEWLLNKQVLLSGNGIGDVLYHSRNHKPILEYLEKFFEQGFEDSDITLAHIKAALGKADFFENKREKLIQPNRLGVSPAFYAYINKHQNLVELLEQEDTPITLLDNISVRNLEANDWRTLAFYCYQLAYDIEGKYPEIAKKYWTEASTIFENINAKERTKMETEFLLNSYARLFPFQEYEINYFIKKLNFIGFQNYSSYIKPDTHLENETLVLLAIYFCRAHESSEAKNILDIMYYRKVIKGGNDTLFRSLADKMNKLIPTDENSLQYRYVPIYREIILQSLLFISDQNIQDRKFISETFINLNENAPIGILKKIYDDNFRDFLLRLFASDALKKSWLIKPGFRALLAIKDKTDADLRSILSLNMDPPRRRGFLNSIKVKSADEQLEVAKSFKKEGKYLEAIPHFLENIVLLENSSAMNGKNLALAESYSGLIQCFLSLEKWLESANAYPKFLEQSKDPLILVNESPVLMIEAFINVEKFDEALNMISAIGGRYHKSSWKWDYLKGEAFTGKRDLKNAGACFLKSYEKIVQNWVQNDQVYTDLDLFKLAQQLPLKKNFLGTDYWQGLINKMKGYEEFWKKVSTYFLDLFYSSNFEDQKRICDIYANQKLKSTKLLDRQVADLEAHSSLKKCADLQSLNLFANVRLFLDAKSSEGTHFKRQIIQLANASEIEHYFKLAVAKNPIGLAVFDGFTKIMCEVEAEIAASVEEINQQISKASSMDKKTKTPMSQAGAWLKHISNLSQNFARILLYSGIVWFKNPGEPKNNNNDNNQVTVLDTKVENSLKLAAKLCAGEWTEDFVSMVLKEEYPPELKNPAMTTIMENGMAAFLKTLSSLLEKESSKTLMLICQEAMQLINYSKRLNNLARESEFFDPITKALSLFSAPPAALASEEVKAVESNQAPMPSAPPAGDLEKDAALPTSNTPEAEIVSSSGPLDLEEGPALPPSDTFGPNLPTLSEPLALPPESIKADPASSRSKVLESDISSSSEAMMQTIIQIQTEMGRMLLNMKQAEERIRQLELESAEQKRELQTLKAENVQAQKKSEKLEKEFDKHTANQKTKSNIRFFDPRHSPTVQENVVEEIVKPIENRDAVKRELRTHQRHSSGPAKLIG